jgi:hypothetical protein
MIRRWGTLVLLAAVVGPAASGAACSSRSNGAQSASPGDGGGVDSSVDGGSLIGADGQGPSLTITPQTATITATGMGGAMGGTEQFHAYVGASTTPVQAQWTVDGPAFGTIDSSGLFTASGQVGGQVGIEAQAGGLHAQAVLTVKLELTDNPGAVSMGTQNQLTGGGSADPALAWLYPYDGTVFPRGLLPPTLQFAGTPPDATYVHLSFSNLDYKGFYGASNPGQVTFFFFN